MLVAIMLGSVLNAQDVKPSFEKQGELVKGTFFYENGTVKQEGTYKNGKLHGEWVSYDQHGDKLAMAEYDQGVKTGKWFFWTEDGLVEVDYNRNAVTQVTNWKNGSTRVVSNE
ncbi:hypothetical protein GCM10009117_06950 [Gangjinia marincola]|uniref:Nicotinic acid mononucleotide adenyltransferase n=2 Tax=Gangjinia marincola TaxID=578463 RepID=A0ABP3XQL9_9FLAO